MLHVLDEQRKLNRDFVCQKDLLLSEMKYFRKYMTEGTNADDIDISVHCDVKIFEWLVAYLHNTVSPPALGERLTDGTRELTFSEPTSVVSILISSEFLQMDRLVKECLQYMHDHVNEVVRVPIDFTCIQDDLLTRLCSLFTESELDSTKDPKDKLVGKLFYKKVRN